MATTYQFQTRSALARVSRVLRQHHIKRGGILGRYPNQTTVHGWAVKRVGVSNTVRLHYWGDNPQHEQQLQILVGLMRDNGLPFDDRGWMTCARGGW